MHEISILSTECREIFSDIKRRYLAMTNFPKFIIGTGLSISVGIPGMGKLADKLMQSFLKKIVNIKRYGKIVSL